MSERTLYIPDVEEAICYLQSHGEGGVRHGSTVRNLARIDPRIAEDLHVHTPTGERVPAEAAISASDNLVVPVFYATVFKPSRLNRLSRGAAAKPLRNDDGRV